MHVCRQYLLHFVPARFARALARRRTHASCCVKQQGTRPSDDRSEASAPAPCQWVLTQALQYLSQKTLQNLHTLQWMLFQGLFQRDLFSACLTSNAIVWTGVLSLAASAPDYSLDAQGNGVHAPPAGAGRKADDPVEHGAPDEGLHKAVGQAQDGHRQRKRPLHRHRPSYALTSRVSCHVIQEVSACNLHMSPGCSPDMLLI